MKNHNSKTLCWVYKNFKPFLPKTIIACLASIGFSLSVIAMALISKEVLEIAERKTNGNIKSYIIAFAVIIALQIVFYAASYLLKVAVTGKFTILLRQKLFKTINAKKYSESSKYHSGDILNRFTTDVEVVVSNTVNILPDLCSILAKIAGGSVALFILNWKIGILVISTGIIVPAIGKIINLRYKYLHKEIVRTEGVTRSFLQECFENSILLKTFKSEKPFINRLKSSMDENYRFKFKRAILVIISQLSLYSFFTLCYYAVLVWGAYQITQDAISFGALMAFLQLISQLRAPLQNISGILPKYYSIIASSERLIELETLKDEESENNILNIPEFKNLSGENISFSYGSKAVLKNFNFSINAGSMTAIVGTSGIGKSTLFKLMLGLYNLDSGSIKINSEINVGKDTRSLFAFVPQGNMILSGSIRDNITLCNPDISQEKIINACKSAQIHDYISSLENGYDTVLSERGGGLSEGQVQRLAIARALLTDAPILLLDEATSALDKETELRLLTDIKELKDKTVILVTHRKTSIDFCDSIIEV